MGHQPRGASDRVSATATERTRAGLGRWARSGASFERLTRTQTVDGSRCPRNPCKHAGAAAAAFADGRITVHSLSRIRRTSERSARKNPLVERGPDEAADGTRTHDLLHGKQYVKTRFPAPYEGFS